MGTLVDTGCDEIRAREDDASHPHQRQLEQPLTHLIESVKDIYWTLGSYDVVAICEAPDDESASALALSVGSRGKVRSDTLRAFSFDEMKRILDKMV